MHIARHSVATRVVFNKRRDVARSIEKNGTCVNVHCNVYLNAILN